MRLRLSKLQENNEETKLFKSSAGLLEGWEEVKRVLQYWGLPYIPEFIRYELINCHHDDLLARYFGIDKIRELVGRKYYWSSLKKDIKSCVRGCNICLTSKTIRHKPYEDLQSLLVSTHQWKNLSMDFVTGLPLSADWKGNSYNSILIIVNQLTMMVHYKPVKVTIDAPKLLEVILDVVV